MERKDIGKNLKIVNARIELLESQKLPRYNTENKYIPSMGYVSELPTKRDCAKALSLIKNKCASEFEAAKELGINDCEIELDVNYLGFFQEIWKEDIKQRLNWIIREEILSKLKDAKQVMLKYRTEEDILQENLDYIMETLNNLN